MLMLMVGIIGVVTCRCRAGGISGLRLGLYTTYLLALMYLRPLNDVLSFEIVAAVST